MSRVVSVELLLACGTTNPLGPFPTPPVQCRMKMIEAAISMTQTSSCSMTLLLSRTLVSLEVILAVNGPIAEVTALAFVLIRTIMVFSTWLHFNVTKTGITRVQKFSALLVTLHAALFKENMNTNMITRTPVCAWHSRASCVTFVLSVLAPTAIATNVLTVRMKKNIVIVLNSELLPQGLAPLGVASILVLVLLYRVLVLVRRLGAILLHILVHGRGSLCMLHRLPIGVS